MALVSHITGQSKHRLEEFGLYKGARIQMFQQSISPSSLCILRMATYKICFRAKACIFVKLEKN